MSFDSSLIYKVTREFKAAQTLRNATRILQEHQNCFLVETGHLRPHWVALQDSGFMDAFLTQMSESMARLSKPSETQGTLGSFLSIGMNTLLVILLRVKRIIGDEKHSILMRLPQIIYLTICAADGYESSNPLTVEAMTKARYALQKTVVLCISEFYSAFNFENILLERMDKEALIRVVFGVLFNSRLDLAMPREDRQKTLMWCTIALSPDKIERFIVGSGKLSSVQAAVGRDGPGRIVENCITLWNDRSGKLHVRGLSQIHLILLHHDYDGLGKAFVEAGVHLSIARNFSWELKTTSSCYGHQKFMSIIRLLSYIETPMQQLATSPTIIATSQLLRDEDFLPLAANALLDFNFDRIDQNHPAYWLVQCLRVWIPQACTYNPDLVGPCRSEWLRILRNFTSLARCDPPSTRADGAPGICIYALALWRELGKALDLEDPLEVPTRTNCSWIRCPLSSQAGPASVRLPSGKSLARWEMIQCSGCHQVQYCGQPCQKRDWTNGHREMCGKPGDVRSLTIKRAV